MAATLSERITELLNLVSTRDELENRRTSWRAAVLDLTAEITKVETQLEPYQDLLDALVASDSDDDSASTSSDDSSSSDSE